MGKKMLQVALTVIGCSVLGIGGFTLFNINIPGRHVQTSEEKQEDIDNDLFTKALNSISGGNLNSKNYVNGLNNLMGISKDYVKRDEVSKLYQQCIEGYIALTISEANELLDEERYDKAADHIGEAKGLLTSISNYEVNSFKLEEEESYINSFKEVSKLIKAEKYRDAILLMKDLGNDERVNILMKSTKDQYEDQVIDEVNQLCSDNNLVNAEKVLNDGIMILGSSTTFKNKINEIAKMKKKEEKSEINMVISDFKKNKQWTKIIDYINSLPDDLKIDFKYDKENAISSLSYSLTSKANEQMDNKNYAEANNILSTGKKYLKNDTRFMKCYNLCYDYSPDKLKFKKVINKGNSKIGFVKDINFNEYNAMPSSFRSEKDYLEFNVINTSYVTGTLYLKYNGNNYNDSLLATVIFKDSRGRVLKTYKNLSYKNTINFSVETKGLEYIKVSADWNTNDYLNIAIR